MKLIGLWANKKTTTKIALVVVFVFMWDFDLVDNRYAWDPQGPIRPVIFQAFRVRLQQLPCAGDFSLIFKKNLCPNCTNIIYVIMADLVSSLGFKGASQLALLCSECSAISGSKNKLLNRLFLSHMIGLLLVGGVIMMIHQVIAMMTCQAL